MAYSQSTTLRPLPTPTNKDIKRYWSKVKKSNAQNCWEWQAGRFDNGYGSFYLQGSDYAAQRIAYLLHNGKDAHPLHVLHRCDNPPCCNPFHLFAGSTQDNSDDMVKKGRSAKGKRNSAFQRSLFTPQDMGIIYLTAPPVSL